MRTKSFHLKWFDIIDYGKGLGIAAKFELSESRHHLEYAHPLTVSNAASTASSALFPGLRSLVTYFTSSYHGAERRLNPSQPNPSPIRCSIKDQKTRQARDQPMPRSHVCYAQCGAPSPNSPASLTDRNLGCWASSGYSVQGCAQLEQALRECMDAPVCGKISFKDGIVDAGVNNSNNV